MFDCTKRDGFANFKYFDVLRSAFRYYFSTEVDIEVDKVVVLIKFACTYRVCAN